MAGLVLLGGLTLLSPFGAWLKEFWGDAGCPRPKAALLPSRGLFLLCDAPRAPRSGEEEPTLTGLRAQGRAAAGTPACCSLAAPTDEPPPCRVLFGGDGARRWALGALPLPCAAADRGVPRMLPGGTSRTPALPSRDGVGARCVAPRPGELGRAGDLGVGVCVLPEGTLRGCAGSRRGLAPGEGVAGRRGPGRWPWGARGPHATGGSGLCERLTSSEGCPRLGAGGALQSWTSCCTCWGVPLLQCCL